MSIELRYRVVDVFSDVPLAGNAVCVVLDPCPEPVMAAIAREVNLSETTFPTLTGERSYEMRIFTPTTELPFAGHPSLGTAWVLGPGAWEQTTEGATLVVEADRDGATMVQPDPVLREAGAAGTGAVEALGLTDARAVQVAEAAGVRHLVVATDAALDRLDPEQGAVTAASRRVGATTLAAVRRLDDRILHVRVFAPVAGIAEDPGTGSAAGPVAVVARLTWGTADAVTILQGAEIGRPCRIEVHAEGGWLRVGGRVAACAEGRFTL
jgi:trans-2,3-dihydro-3-hydroxyanthranilate isomerase